MFTVNWLDEALAELAEVWAAANPAVQQEMRTALTAIYQRLTTDPYEASESREENERIAFALPLGIRFEVDDTISHVYVLAVWRIRRKGEAE